MASVDRAGAAIALSEGDIDGAIAGLRRGVGRAIGGGDMNLVCELYLDLSQALLRAAWDAHDPVTESADGAEAALGLGARLEGPLSHLQPPIPASPR